MVSLEPFGSAQGTELFMSKLRNTWCACRLGFVVLRYWPDWFYSYAEVGEVIVVEVGVRLIVLSHLFHKLGQE